MRPFPDEHELVMAVLDCLEGTGRTLVMLTALTKAQVERVRGGLLDGSLRRAGRAGTPLAPRSITLALQVFQQGPRPGDA